MRIVLIIGAVLFIFSTKQLYSDTQSINHHKAVHAIAMTLVHDQPVTWSMGEYSGTAYTGSGLGKCKFLNVDVNSVNGFRQKSFNACRGGGTDNTWIIDNLWTVSSVTRRTYGNCQTRYVFARLNNGRMYSELNVCFNNTQNTWSIEGN